jgi:hypothetical protein
MIEDQTKQNSMNKFNFQFSEERKLWKVEPDPDIENELDPELTEVYFECNFIDELRKDEVWQSLIEDVTDNPATLSCNFSLAFDFDGGDKTWEITTPIPRINARINDPVRFAPIASLLGHKNGICYQQDGLIICRQQPKK